MVLSFLLDRDAYALILVLDLKQGGGVLITLYSLQHLANLDPLFAEILLGLAGQESFGGTGQGEWNANIDLGMLPFQNLNGQAAGRA
jgi:hypothetical protein